MKKQLLLSTLLLANINSVFAESKVLVLDGNSDYLNLSSHSTNLIFSSPATIEFWLKPNFDHKTSSLGGTIWSISDGNALGFGERFEIRYGQTSTTVSNERISIVHARNATQTIYSLLDTGTYTNEWHHYTITCSGTAWTLYVDGVLQTLVLASASSSFAGDYGESFSPETYTNIGIRQLSTTEYDLNGSLDEIRLWNVVKNQNEIQASYNLSLLGNETNLVGYWNFDDNTANDVTANNYDATFVGNSAIQTDTEIFPEPGYNLLEPVNGDTVGTLNIKFDWSNAPTDSFALGSQIFYKLEVGFDSSFATGSGANFLNADSLTNSEYETDYVATLQSILTYLDTLIDTTTSINFPKYTNQTNGFVYPAIPLYWRVLAFAGSDSLSANQTGFFNYKLGTFDLFAPFDSTNYQTAPDSISFSWEQVGSSVNTAYVLFLAKTLSFEDYFVLPVADTNASQSDVVYDFSEADTLAEGNYYWLVVAVTGLVGGTDYEVELSKQILYFSIGDTTTVIPDVVNDLKIEATATSIQLTWTAVTNATSYNVYKSGSPNEIYLTTNLIGNTATNSYTIDTSSGVLTGGYFVVTSVSN
ncbi:LamG domain-containing protein [bacterium]|nr:LamG domain-containing protein [bacterium]